MRKYLPFLLTPLYAFSANSFLLFRSNGWLLAAVTILLLYVNVLAGMPGFPVPGLRMKICHHGLQMITAFLGSVVISVTAQIVLAFTAMPKDPGGYLWNLLFCIGAHLLLFWNSILCIYLTSYQLGIKLRVLGALCGMIPVVNLVVLSQIIRVCSEEVDFEANRYQRSRERIAAKVCATKYPIVLVHGVFFRDWKNFNYWGRIPEDLILHGATLYYGNHQSADLVADSAQELAQRIRELVQTTGCGKVNIIAHSKGGLDCRYAIANLGIGEYVASLTTVNSPHRGCQFADYLLQKIPKAVQNSVASTYNLALRKLGDPNPDFMGAVGNLTAASCRAFDAETPVPEGIYCQSIGSIMPTARGGKFPMNFSYHLMEHFEGEGDGLVSEASFRWGEKYILLRPSGNRGISHGDIIDMNRENIPGFDVRDFYVDLVSDLRQRGL